MPAVAAQIVAPSVCIDSEEDLFAGEDDDMDIFNAESVLASTFTACTNNTASQIFLPAPGTITAPTIQLPLTLDTPAATVPPVATICLDYTYWFLGDDVDDSSLFNAVPVNAPTLAASSTITAPTCRLRTTAVSTTPTPTN